MIVEFYGLSGSGKSTLARKIAKNTEFKIIKINSRLELVYYNFLYKIKHPIKFFITFIYLFKNSSGPKDFYYKFMNTFLGHNAKYEKAKKNNKAIIDQGHLQNIISVFKNEYNSKKILKYLKFLPLPDKLVIFDIDKKNREKWLDKRNWRPRENFDKKYLDKWLKITEKNDKIFKENIKAVPTKIFVITDADKQFDKLVEFIVCP